MNQAIQTLEAAAVPAVVGILEAAGTAFATIFNGDPATALIRADVASKIFIGQAEMSLLQGGASEFGALGSAAQAGIADLIAKVKALAVPAAAAAV